MLHRLSPLLVWTLAVATLASAPLAQDLPLGAQPAWARSGDELWAWFGFAVIGTGDVNGDGIDDVAVAAPLHDAGAGQGANLGLVCVLHGSSSTPGSAGNHAGQFLQEATTLVGDDPGSSFGKALAAGDFDGDGLADLAVGAPNHGDGFAAAGRVFIYRGSSAGLQTPPAQLAGPQPGSQFGAALSCAGDVDGDGDDELLIGAPFFDASATNVGRAGLFNLSPTTGEWSEVATFVGWTAQGQAGFAVAEVGDVDGDGFADFAVGAPDIVDPAHAGRVYLFLGDLELTGQPDGPLTLDPAWSTSGTGGEQLGYALAALGDLDGDGLDDFAMGAPFFDGTHENEGCVYLVPGCPEFRSTAGVGAASGGSTVSVEPVRVAAGGAANETLGRRISGLGDVDGDGRPEVLVVSGHEHAGNTGALLVFRVPAEDPLTWSELWCRAGTSLDGWLAGAMAGDLNDDGFCDIVAGAWGAELEFIDEGRALVFAGRSSTAFTSYCEATPNTTGAPAAIEPVGAPSQASGYLELHASPVPAGPGLFFYGDRQQQLPFWNGWLCVGGSIQRGSLHSSVEQVLSDSAALTPSTLLEPGTHWNFQAWYRDAPSSTGANLSNAVAVHIEP